MYEELNCFEEYTQTFWYKSRDYLCHGTKLKRISSEDVYQLIKEELKSVKKCRKRFNKGEEECQ